MLSSHLVILIKSIYVKRSFTRFKRLHCFLHIPVVLQSLIHRSGGISANGQAMNAQCCVPRHVSTPATFYASKSFALLYWGLRHRSDGYAIGKAG